MGMPEWIDLKPCLKENALVIGPPTPAVSKEPGRRWRAAGLHSYSVKAGRCKHVSTLWPLG